MKKKILSLCLVCCLVAVAAIGGTLAYFTDKDEETNTFTVGKVTIDLIEQQRNNAGTALEDFTQNKELNPIVGGASEGNPKDNLQLPTAKNYVDKVVTVKNTGTEDAYVRAYFAIPSVLDDGYETFNAGLNVLHFNFGYKADADGNPVATEGVEWIWKHKVNGADKWNYFETTMKDGIKYNVYYADYYTTLANGATTERLINGVYLDQTFDTEEVADPNGDTKLITQYFVKNNGQEKVLTLPEGWDWSAVKCPVFAVAVQAAGFSSADEAVTAAFGANYNPWGGTVTNWQ